MRKILLTWLTTALVMTAAIPAGAQTEEEKLAASVEELRNAAGSWSVTTEFLAADGSVAREIEGEYVFEWVVEGRVLSGYNHIPDLDQKSAILFYINEKEGNIEMASVGSDGHLWIMTGPLGGDTRYSQEFQSSEGNPSQLRFTRFNVSGDRFESRMEYTEDGGETWIQGNHQVFTRKKNP